MASEIADGEFLAEFSVFTPTGELVETIRGRLLRAPKVGERLFAKPSVTPIPFSRLASDLRALLPKVPLTLATVNHEELQNLEDLSEISKADSERIRVNIATPRQQSVIANLVVARRAALSFARQYRNLDFSPTQLSIAYRDGGKPELRFDEVSVAQAFAGIDVSLADGADISVALIGLAPVGVDIEIVEARDAETWRGLLGDDGYALALCLATATAEPFDRSATRVWTLLEAGKKANGLKKLVPRYEAPLGGPWLSCAGAVDAGTLDFLCVTLSSFGKAVATAVLTVTMSAPYMLGESVAAEHRAEMV